MLTPDHDGARPAPALTARPGGYLIDLMIGNLHVHTPHPITEAAARECARLLWGSFGVEIDGERRGPADPAGDRHLSLRAANKAPRTIDADVEAGTKFVKFLGDKPQVNHRDIQRYLVHPGYIPHQRTGQRVGL